MCGRYFLDTLPETMAEHFSVNVVPKLKPSYNVAPTQVMPIVVEKDGERRIGPARWGLIPFWSRDARIAARCINARAETLSSKPAFREAWKRRRCLVPASGFFEWHTQSGRKQPYVIRPVDQGLIALGGLWERWQAPDGETVISYAVVTTQPNARVAPLHDRMPVIIRPERYTAWMTGEVEQLQEDLEPIDPELIEVYPVGPDVGSPRHNHPGLIERA